MKHFFKFTAIIACAVLAFSSCNEEYVAAGDAAEGDPVVGTSSIMDLRPGFNQFDLSFIVNSNENITSCAISWSSTDASGADTIAVVPGGEYTFVSIDTLPAGDYTISLMNMCEDIDDFYTVAEERPVSVFDDSTYADVTGVLIDAIYFDGTDAEIVWGDTPDDCVGVVVTYVMGADTVSTDILASSGSIFLEDADMASAFTYVSYFAPDGAIDDHYVLIDNTDTSLTTVPYESPEAPMTIFSQPGDGKLKVTWTVWDDSYLSQAIITCNEIEYIVDVADMDTSRNGENSYTIEGLTAADYDVTISHACVHDIDGTETTVISKELTSTGIEVYQTSVFEASTPKLWNIYYHSNGTTLYVNFIQGAIDCEYITFTYVSTITGGSLPTTVSRFSSNVGTTNVMQGSEYSYTVTFALPTDALDGTTMTVYGGEGLTPIVEEEEEL